MSALCALNLVLPTWMTLNNSVYAFSVLLRSFNPIISIIGSDGEGRNPTAS